ncbi:MAG: glycosyltransferase family 4 protein [candidate division WOR-3 bacterium]
MKNYLRICLVSAAYRPYPSGVSEHIYNLAVALKNLGQDVTILTTNFPNYSHLKTSFDEPVPVFRFGRAVLVPLNRSYATLPVGWNLPNQVAGFLSRNRFNIVHCHGLFWPEISYWAIHYSNAVNLVTFLTAGFKIHTSYSGLFRLLFRHQIKKIHGRIAISNRAKAAIEHYLPGEYRIIPSGIDLTRFSPLIDRRKPSGSPTILFVGRLDKRKGVTVLIRAMPLILKFLPEARLIVVGKGPMDKACQILVQRLGIAKAVDFVGAVSQSDLPNYYHNADVFCSPALGGETQGVVLLEAMACGVPVVASRIPGYDETVQDGINGLLCPPNDIKSLSQLIVQVLINDKLRCELINNALERVKLYAWPLVAEKTLNYYLELLGYAERVTTSR